MVICIQFSIIVLIEETYSLHSLLRISYTKLYSKAHLGGDEEPARRTLQYVEECDEETTKVGRRRQLGMAHLKACLARYAREHTR